MESNKTLSPQKKEEIINLLNDLISTNKSYKRCIPQHWINKLGELQTGLKEEKNEFFSQIIEGHPQYATRFKELEYIIPIKIKKGDNLNNKYSKAQAVFDKYASKISHAELALKTAKTAKQKKTALINWSQLDQARTIIEVLKEDIFPELKRLAKLSNTKR